MRAADIGYRWDAIVGLASGLLFLRKHNLIHRDLKPQNLLLDSDSNDATLKIADFGFARYMQPQSLAATLCGSPLYMVLLACLPSFHSACMLHLPRRALMPRVETII